MIFFVRAVVGLLSVAATNAVHQQADIYYHEKSPIGASMWHFSADGLTIYSPNGSVIKNHRKKSVCKPYTNWRGEVSEDCYYFAYASDGHKYVWAASMAGKSHVDVFDIDTGDFAGYMNTCSTPLDLEYHTTRREMWVRCAQQDSANGHAGEIDVFSSDSLSSDFDLIHLNDTGRPYGRIVTHSSMGPVGYVSAYDQSYISELDLSSKEVAERYEIPLAYGSYDMTFSPVNEHAYLRVRVCCTCGEGKDVESCGRGGASQVLVQTGPSASSSEQDGVCSGGCEGSPADTIGVIEFDTVNKQFVAQHNIKTGTGFGADPVASPNGKYVLLLPNDGGQYVRVIKPGSNGQASQVVRDVNVGFANAAENAGKIVISDFAFVNDAGRDFLVLAASTDNEIAIVDLGTSSFNMVKLNLSPGTEESTGGGSRKVEWAVGTNYVWVDGGESKEQYIIEIGSTIGSAKIRRTLTEVTSGNMIFVNNYERLRVAQMMEKMTTQMAQDITSNDSNSESYGNNMNGGSSSSSLRSNDDNGNQGFGIAALSISCISLVVALILGAKVFLSNDSSSSTQRGSQEKFVDDPETAKSLGSKQVN